MNQLLWFLDVEGNVNAVASIIDKIENLICELTNTYNKILDNVQSGANHDNWNSRRLKTFVPGSPPWQRVMTRKLTGPKGDLSQTHKLRDAIQSSATKSRYYDEFEPRRYKPIIKRHLL